MTKAWLPLLVALTMGLASPLLGDTVYKYRLPELATPSQYVLDVDVDLDKFTFSGEATVTLKVLKPTKTLTLNAKDLVVLTTDVTLDDLTKPTEKKVIPTTNAEVDNNLEFLVLTFGEELKSGQQYQLKVKYTGKLNDDKRGFYRSRYIDKDGKTKYVAATHFEPTGARLAFPCFDEPAYKAMFKISITHSKSYSAISNMPQEKTPDPVGTDKRKTTFKESPLMSSYLVAFIVSDYGLVENKEKTFRVWTKPHAVEQGRYALEMGEKLLNKLSDYTNLKYHKYMQKMDQVTLKDFLPGAMENWGLVTYRETALLVEDGVTTTRNKQSITTIIAHEFTHQWFGNLVSPKWWTYVWLNEGFADYFEYFITHEVIPEWRLNETFVVDNIQARAFVADALGTSRPMNQDADAPADIRNLFDTIAYQKAGSVIRMMSHILSETAFQKGLREYLSKKALSNAESTELLKFLDEASGKTWEGKLSFDQVMDAWVNKPGYPVVTVTKNDDGSYQLVQEQFTLNVPANNTKWWVPIAYTTESQGDFKNTTPVAWLNPSEEKLTLPKQEKEGWIIVNTQLAGYYRVNYDKENWELLTTYLQKNPVDGIHVLNRAQLIDDALNMARTNRLNYTTALSLTLYLNKEVDYIPWHTTFRNLNFLENMLRVSSKYDIFKEYIRHILKGVIKEVGYEPKEKESEKDRKEDLKKLLRINVMKWACKAGEESCRNHTQTILNTWVKNSDNKLDVDLRGAIICAGIRSENETTWNSTLDALVKSSYDEDLKKSLVASLACTESTATLKTFLISATAKDYQVSFDAAVQAVVSENAAGVDIALDVLSENYEKIKNLEKGEDLIKSSVTSIGSAITNKDQFLKLSTFVAKQGLKAELLQTSILQATQNIEWLDFHRATIEDWLVEHQEHFNSASSLTIASFLVALSLLITRFY